MYAVGSRRVDGREACASKGPAARCVFLAVSGCVFALAKLHPARPGLPKVAAGTKVRLGDYYRGQTAFSQKCAACHGVDGKGGGIGPKLVGLALPLAAAKAQID